MGRLHIAGGSCFYLDEAEHVFASIFRPSNQIDLAAMAGSAKIPRHHHIAFLAQIKVGVFFAPTSCAEMGWQLIPSAHFIPEAELRNHFQELHSRLHHVCGKLLKSKHRSEFWDLRCGSKPLTTEGTEVHREKPQGNARQWSPLCFPP